MLGANDVVTVWNRYRDETGRDCWLRHVVPGCVWNGTYSRTTMSTTSHATVEAELLVSENADYRPFQVWQSLPEAEKKAAFTFCPGDLVALGAHETDITGSAPFTEPVVRERLKPDVFAVSGIKDNRGPGKLGGHLVVTGPRHGNHY